MTDTQEAANIPAQSSNMPDSTGQSGGQTVYNHHPDTRIYTGASQADESPLEPGVYLIPAHATTVAPPDVPEGHLARWRLDDGMWEIVPDIHGTWYDADGQIVQIDDLDADVSALTRAAPPDATYKLVKGKWAQCPTKAAAAKKAEMDAAIAAGMAEANRRIAVLQDAVDLDMTTPEEEAALKSWKRYRVLLSRVQSDPAYPDGTLPDQPGKVF